MHNKPHSEESKMKISEAHKGIKNESRRRETVVKDGVTLYRCGTCKKFKPYEDFYKNKRTILGITSECKKCHCEESMKTRNVDLKRESNQRYMEHARKEDPKKFRERDRERKREKDEKYYARKALNNAVKRGDIVKPNCCESCGKNTRVTAHHEDYTKPLDVKWLCYKCHGKIHRNNYYVSFERCERPEWWEE